jgi:hypothetical protein
MVLQWSWIMTLAQAGDKASVPDPVRIRRISMFLDHQAPDP